MGPMHSPARSALGIELEIPQLWVLDRDAQIQPGPGSPVLQGLCAESAAMEFGPWLCSQLLVLASMSLSFLICEVNSSTHREHVVSNLPTSASRVALLVQPEEAS